MRDRGEFTFLLALVVGIALVLVVLGLGASR
jgi:hypothetical protein